MRKRSELLRDIVVELYNDHKRQADALDAQGDHASADASTLVCEALRSVTATIDAIYRLEPIQYVDH